MKTSVKIKGILATADVSLAELGALVGLSRQTLHNYLNVNEVENYTRGLQVIEVTNQLMKLAVEGRLPLPKGTPAAERIPRLKEMLPCG